MRGIAALLGLYDMCIVALHSGPADGSDITCPHACMQHCLDCMICV